MLIIGRNPVLEALRFNYQSIEKINIMKGLSDKKIKQIEKEAKHKNIDINYVDKKFFQDLFDDTDKSEGISQGIAAIAKDYKYSVISEIIVREKPTSDIILLDEIQDPHNLGAIIRTAAGVGINGILITEKNSTKVNHTVIKASSGAVNLIKIALIQNIYKTIEFLKKEGYYIIGSDIKSNTDLFSFEFPDKCVLILGNEGEGIRKNILKLCDSIVKIPIKGQVESLNVSVSAGVILYELLRQRNY